MHFNFCSNDLTNANVVYFLTSSLRLINYLLLCSLFEFEQYGDENFGTEKSGVLPPSERANDGKMEKSFMNFKKHHPNFEGGAAAQNMVNRIHAYKDNKYVSVSFLSHIWIVHLSFYR